MKIKQRILAALLTSAMAAASAQTAYHVHEEFYEGDVFDGTVTFSSDFSTISSVLGSLFNPYTGTRTVSGINPDSYQTFSPGVKGVALTGDEGFPAGYLLSLAWDYKTAPGLGLPQFVTGSYYDPSTGITNYYYSNSINGLNFATVSSISAVPEPATYAMLLGGLGALALLRRRKAV